MARSDQMVPAHRSVSGKAWVTDPGIKTPCPHCGDQPHEQIDPAFRRRFAYHLELKSPPPGAREGLVRKMLEGVRVSADFVARLTARKGLTPAQIRTAVRFATLASEPGRDTDSAGMLHILSGGQGALMESLIERQLKNADLALGNRAHAPGRRSVTTYDLSMLNVEARFDVPRIVQALKSRGHGSLCFYGAPGTGKTALAEYIAAELECPMIVRQASNLMSNIRR